MADGKIEEMANKSRNERRNGKSENDEANEAKIG
jgi:hypothetical protein